MMARSRLAAKDRRMFAYRDCAYDREAALALAAGEGGSRYIHGILSETGPERFGIPPSIGYLAFMLFEDGAGIPALMAAIGEGADLSPVADLFALWVIDTYALPCAEGDAVARHYLRFARSIVNARLEGCLIDEGVQKALRFLAETTEDLTRPKTLAECALLAAWGIFRLRPSSAGIVAYAALCAEERVAGRDTAARRAMTVKLIALLTDAP